MPADLWNSSSHLSTGGILTNRKVILILLSLILSSGVCLADSYVGGIPLTPVHNGTVDGGVYFDSYYGTGDQQSKGSKTIEKTFTIPANADVEWAMLLTTVYCGHMQNNYQGTANVNFNGQTLGTETLNVPFAYLINGGDGYVKVNDHTNRVTSDYMMYYDVTNLVKSGENKAVVKTDPLDSSFDGRVKMITLVVAYNDGSGKNIWYQVNRGHDPDTYYGDDELGENYIGSTAFEAALPDGSSLTDSKLTILHLASTDGTYIFNGKALTSGSPQGTYTGSNTWNVKDSLKSSGTNTLTYDRTAAFYKNALGILTAEYTESQESAPVANFTASSTSGNVPLTVQFTDTSTGSVSSYAWDFDNDGTVDSTDQNPLYTYTTAGTYSVNLTVTNSGGSDSELKTGYITVNAGATNDLTISGAVNPVPASAVFAKEPNTVRINNIKNTGPSSLTNITVALYASDVSDGTVPVNTTKIASLESGETTSITLLDPTIRNLEGGTVTYTAVVDPENLIAETNEANNNKSSPVKPVKYNGYKGKRYWEGGSDITTKQTYDLQGNLVYFTQPSSAYKSVGWIGRTETWTESNLPIPASATVENVWLYVPYNWDTTSGGVPKWTIAFNEKTLTNGTLYTDKSNFGGYADYTYGLYVYDVTSQFKSTGNSLTLTPEAGNSNALYPSTLVVIYKDPSESRKQIFINEECDELGYSVNSYGTTLEEATAYAPFTGMEINVSAVKNATLYNFAGSAGPDEGNLIFNGNTVATNAWQGDPSTSSAQVFDIKDYIKATGNEAGIQGTESGGMCAFHQILVIEYPAPAPAPAPVEQPDLIVSAINVNAGEIFANEANNISAEVQNIGTVASGSFRVTFAVDGIDTNVTVNDLAPGANTTLIITDSVIRNFGESVKIGVTADPENTISESNETNNQIDVTKTVVYNGYKGKRYTNGSDITTQATFEGRYGLVYSAGNTAYTGASWTAKTYSWSSADLPVPAGAIVESARLYQPYAWNKMTTDPAFTMSFNNNTVTPIATYKDRKSYGVYDYPYGLYVYDVTSSFNPAGNSITITPEAGNNYGIYGAYLVIVYKDSTVTEKKIWINDEFDMLASKNTYAVTSEEATAYATFNVVNSTGISGATAISIIASGNDADKSKFFFNDKEYTGFWVDYQTTPQVGFSSYNVTEAVQDGTDTARIQSYDTGNGGDSMYAMNVILIAEYAETQNSTTAPVAAFIATPTSGDAPLMVNFTDQSEGSPTSWLWDFGDGNTSKDQNPMHTYSTAGTYTVNLTVSNENGTDSKLATINVSQSEFMPIFPGCTNPPIDLDQDGLYEDINGNGERDFDDVVTYYENMDWMEENVSIAFFDYNNNGLIDFDDVVKLHNGL